MKIRLSGLFAALLLVAGPSVAGLQLGGRGALAGDFCGWADDKEPDTRAEDEAFAKRLVELIVKTVEESEATQLDQTPLSSYEGADAEAATAIHRTLDGSRITLNFDGNTFEEALDFFRDVTGLNIILSRRATDLVGNDNTKVKLRLKDVQLRNALELLLTQTDAQLRYGIKNGVLQIGIAEDWKGRNLILDVIPIEDLLYRPPDFVAPEAGLDFLKQKWKR